MDPTFTARISRTFSPVSIHQFGVINSTSLSVFPSFLKGGVLSEKMYEVHVVHILDLINWKHRIHRNNFELLGRKYVGSSKPTWKEYFAYWRVFWLTYQVLLRRWVSCSEWLWGHSVGQQLGSSKYWEWRQKTKASSQSREWQHLFMSSLWFHDYLNKLSVYEVHGENINTKSERKLKLSWNKIIHYLLNLIVSEIFKLFN